VVSRLVRRPRPGGADPGEPGRGNRSLLAVTAVVASAALSARTWVMLRDGGLLAPTGYDPGVYYAAADSLVHGLLPYRDFWLLHPPGIMLALSPFAAFGSVTSDPAGMGLARVAVIVLGALNAVLVARIAYRFGLVAALTGGLFYAGWLPVVRVETTARLEPFGNTALLLALLFLLRPRGRVSARAEVLGGLCLGATACFKIWGIVPLLVVLGWRLLDRGRRSAVRVAAGAATAGAAICLPFFVVAPDRMLRMVVIYQLGRPRSNVSPVERLYGAISVREWVTSPSLLRLVATAAVVLAVTATSLAWRERSARIVVVLLLTQTALLFAAPSFFGFYAAFVVPAAALTLAVAAGRLARSAGEHGPRVRIAAVGLLCTAVAAAAALLVPVGRPPAPFPGRQLGAAAGNLRCVLSDNPLALVQMDVLSRNLRNGCSVWVDVTGRTYDPGVAFDPAGRRLPRTKNPVWQRQILAYLRSADAVVLARPGTGLSAATKRTIAGWPILARVDGYTLRAPPDGVPPNGSVPSR